MKKFFLLGILAFTSSTFAAEVPTINVPMTDRQSNWEGSRGQGSCVHAAWVTLLRWQNKYEFADYWRNKYGNGEYSKRFLNRLDAEGVHYAHTYNQCNIKFLEWAMRTRRGAIVNVGWKPHVVCLVYLDNETIGILDNNNIDEIIYYNRKEFLNFWCNNMSWATTPMYAPAAPIPTTARR